MALLSVPFRRPALCNTSCLPQGEGGGTPESQLHPHSEAWARCPYKAQPVWEAPVLPCSEMGHLGVHKPGCLTSSVSPQPLRQPGRETSPQHPNPLLRPQEVRVDKPQPNQAVCSWGQAAQSLSN